MATLRDALGVRLQRLKQTRQEVVARAKADVGKLDAQIAACEDLYLRWDTLTINDGLAALEKTGLSVKVD